MQKKAMPTPIIAGNWKMHKGPDEAREFAQRLIELGPRGEGQTLVIFPPAISLTTLATALAERPDIRIGLQNIHWQESGAFTGEVSAKMAREAGATLALVGHSERRHIFGETNEETRLKVAAALEAGLTPVICLGETEEEREAGRLAEVITRQLEDALEGLSADQVAGCFIAYEPVWAIGTGKTATPGDAAEAHSILREKLTEIAGTQTAGGVPILYGGSVNPGNAAELSAARNVDGLLIGGASLEPESFAEIADTLARPGA